MNIPPSKTIDLLLTIDIPLWLNGCQSFTSQLFELIHRADRRNREKLRAGFPDQVTAYEIWFAG